VKRPARHYPAGVPEGDTIFRTAAVLRSALAGKPLVRFEAPRRRFAPFDDGVRVRSVEARGKHLLIAFDDGRVLHTHLQMSGSWHVYPTGARWRRPAHQVRTLVEVPETVAVCFEAPVVELLRERDLARHPWIAALGPDLCSPNVDLDEVLARVGRLPSETEIGVALLDQRVASGIGNVYRSETLFACRIDPFARVGDLDADLSRRLYATASELLRRNLDGGPRATAPGGLAVYRKTGRPCPRCRTPIRSRRQGEAARTVYWCPSCQAAVGERADDEAAAR
jgi:endonuclease-8